MIRFTRHAIVAAAAGLLTLAAAVPAIADPSHGDHPHVDPPVPLAPAPGAAQPGAVVTPGFPQVFPQLGQPQFKGKLNAGVTHSAIRSIAPLDSNPLTRAWSQDSLKLSWNPEGVNEKNFVGTIEVGYQIGYPGLLTGALQFQWLTPGLSVGVGHDGPEVSLNSLIPQAGVRFELGFTPGIKSVPVSTGQALGKGGELTISGYRASVTGAIGPVTIQPYITLRSFAGDSTTAWGTPTVI